PRLAEVDERDQIARRIADRPGADLRQLIARACGAHRADEPFAIADGRELAIENPVPPRDVRAHAHELHRRHRPQPAHHAEVNPPSMTITEPVVNDAASDSKYTAAPAISAGWAWRCIGVRLTIWSRSIGLPTIADANFVSTSPGAIAFTRICELPS